MKINLLVKPAIVLMIAGGLSVGFLGCEPQGLADQSEIYDEAALKMMQSEKSTLPHKEIAQVRRTVAAYHNFETANKAGWSTDITGYIPHMGHHYANLALFDDKIDLLNPEILIFIPDEHGIQRFVGVEYIAPLDLFKQAPEGFSGSSDVWVINDEAHAWTLHLWIGLQNPDGIFEMHNMRIP